MLFRSKEKVLVIEPFNNFFIPFREQYADYYSIGAINKSSIFFKKDIPPVKGFINGNHNDRNWPYF